MRLRDHITERYTPSVVVLATPEAEAACRDKNGLSVVDLLRPFGFFHHLSGKSESVSLQRPSRSFIGILAVNALRTGMRDFFNIICNWCSTRQDCGGASIPHQRVSLAFL